MWSKLKHYMKWKFMTGHLLCTGACSYILRNTGIFALDYLYCVMDIGGRYTSIVVQMQRHGRQHS